MTPARGYLVYRETVTGATVTRERDPIGAVWVLSRRDGSSFVDTARAEARRLYKLPGHQRAHVRLNSPLVTAIQKRRERLFRKPPDTAGRPLDPEPYAASHRAVMLARQDAIVRKLNRDLGERRQMSPGGVGLL